MSILLFFVGAMVAAGVFMFLNQKKEKQYADRLAELLAEASAKGREAEMLERQLAESRREHQRQVDEIDRRNERDKAELQSVLGERFGERLKLVQEQLSTTTERLGFTGREEGISAYAVVLLCKGE